MPWRSAPKPRNRSPSRRIDTAYNSMAAMNDGKALTANFVTALLVIIASRFGLPVSTTHVSVGAITAVGVVNGTASGGMISRIAAAWLITLPLAAVMGLMTLAVLREF